MEENVSETCNVDYEENNEIKYQEKEIIENDKSDIVVEKLKSDEKKYDVSTQEDSKKNFIKEVKSYAIIIVAAILVAVFVNTFILSNTRIPTGSMENTIMCGNRLFGNRLAYKFSKPKRGDIIIFKYPDDPEKKINYIKRVIGLPGETVKIVGGKVYVDDKMIEENYLKETPLNNDFGPYEVPENSYFVLGDNRNNSNDARYWENTYVKEDDIIAKAVLRYWPKINFVK